MTSMLQHIKESKKLIIAVMVLAIVAMPMGVQALTGQDEKPTTEIEQTTEETTETEEIVTETPVEEVPTEETPITEEEEVIVDDEDIVDEDPIGTAVTLEEARLIAEIEHPDSTVVKNKTKEKNGETYFIFYFEDGWKVKVRASDGTVVAARDGHNMAHSCQNKHKNHNGGNRKNGESSRSEFKKELKNKHDNRKSHRFHNHSDRRS